MSNRRFEDRVKKIVAAVFGIPIDSVDDESNADTIEKWESLSHINLILAIEAEFAVSLSPEEAMEMLSVKLIRMTLEDKGTGESE